MTKKLRPGVKTRFFGDFLFKSDSSHTTMVSAERKKRLLHKQKKKVRITHTKKYGYVVWRR